jgi:Repeat of unknown function (DUF5648)
LYQPNAHDYFYTTSAGEKRHAIANLGFKDEGIACYVFAKAESNTSPLYRLYKPDPYAHFYTRHAAERDKALHDFGFKDEGIACYVYETRQAGTFPFYRCSGLQVTSTRCRKRNITTTWAMGGE